MSRPEKVPGLSVTQSRSVAVALIVVGVTFGVVAVVWDLNGGPTWLHAFTWVGSSATAFGIATLVRAHNEAKRLR